MSFTIPENQSQVYVQSRNAKRFSVLMGKEIEKVIILRESYQDQIIKFLDEKYKPGQYGDLRPREWHGRKISPLQVLKEKVKQIDTVLERRSKAVG